MAILSPPIHGKRTILPKGYACSCISLICSTIFPAFNRFILPVISSVFLVFTANADASTTGIPYVTKAEINGGKPVKIELWEWSGARAKYEKKWIEEYKKLYPNVEINLSIQPWKTYKTSLLTNLISGHGPAMFHLHTSFVAELCTLDLIDELPERNFDYNYLEKDWIGFESGITECPDGSKRYLPMGASMPVIYINNTLWNEAGLTESDYPETWQQLITLSRQLTQYDARNRITVAGFAFHPRVITTSLLYQQGRYVLNASASKVQVMNPEYENVLLLLRELMQEHQVFDVETNDLGLNGFKSARSAMYLGLSWNAGELALQEDKLNWSAIPLPTFENSKPSAYGLVHSPIDLGVNSALSTTQAFVAWDFLHFVYSQQNIIMNDLGIANGFIPPVRSMLNSPVLRKNPVLAMLSEHVTNSVFIGFSSNIMKEQKNLVDLVLHNPESPIKTLMKKSEARLNLMLKNQQLGGQNERNFANHHLMIPNQP